MVAWQREIKKPSEKLLKAVYKSRHVTECNEFHMRAAEAKSYSALHGK